VALPLPEAFRPGLAREARRVGALDRGARTVPAENLHVTLAFLGDTDEQRVPALEEALRAAVAGHGAVPARPARLGAFPSARHPRVVWAGIEEEGPPGALAALAGAVTAALEAGGFTPDRAERFHAHVTLARLASRPSPELEKALTVGALQDTYSTQMLSVLELMVSARAPGGGPPRYRALARIPLAEPRLPRAASAGLPKLE
jgi:2'-5' RNA ligase